MYWIFRNGLFVRVVRFIGKHSNIYRSILVNGSGKRLFIVHIGLCGEWLNKARFLQIPDKKLIFQFRFYHKRFKHRFLSMYDVVVGCVQNTETQNTHKNFDSFNSKKNIHFSLFLLFSKSGVFSCCVVMSHIHFGFYTRLIWCWSVRILFTVYWRPFSISYLENSKQTQFYFKWSVWCCLINKNIEHFDVFRIKLNSNFKNGNHIHTHIMFVVGSREEKRLNINQQRKTTNKHSQYELHNELRHFVSDWTLA